jgi:hypothetical protein
MYEPMLNIVGTANYDLLPAVSNFISFFNISLKETDWVEHNKCIYKDCKNVNDWNYLYPTILKQ